MGRMEVIYRSGGKGNNSKGGQDKTSARCTTTDRGLLKSLGHDQRPVGGIKEKSSWGMGEVEKKGCRPTPERGRYLREKGSKGSSLERREIRISIGNHRKRKEGID